MQFFSTITTIALGLFAAQAVAQSTQCGNPGDQCNNPGQTACQCNGGDLLKCNQNQGGTGFTYQFDGDCPSNPGGFACVNGACVVS